MDGGLVQGGQLLLHIGVVLQVGEGGEGADFHHAVLFLHIAQLVQLADADDVLGGLVALVELNDNVGAAGDHSAAALIFVQHLHSFSHCGGGVISKGLHWLQAPFCASASP